MKYSMVLERIRLIRCSLLALIIVLAAGALELRAEYIFTSDGAIHYGRIVSENANTIVLLTDENKKETYKRADIIRILYTKLKMAKVFIQKRDGKAVIAFIVDEDQETYTCRTDLYKTEEFTLKRGDILFMAEKNPSGLQVEGDIGTDSVRLTWLPPYGDVKKYNVYIKQNEGSEYKPAGSTKDKSITLRDLVSNTTYFIIVTSVDKDEYESTPSNELKITTANLHPDRPDILSVEKDALNGAITYRWNPASDPDGKVVKYRIYGTRNKKRELVQEVKGEVYILKNPENFSRLELVALDDRGDESGPARLDLLRSMYTFSLSPGVIVPLGKFGEMAGTGYGGMFSLGASNLLSAGMEIGPGIGLYYAPGRDMSSENKPVNNSFIIVPLLLNTGYRFSLNDSFSIFPSFSLGMSFLAISYKSIDPLTLVYTGKSKTTFDPTVMAGLEAEYIISDSFSLSVYAGYGMFIEKDGPMHFAAASIAFKYMLL